MSNSERGKSTEAGGEGARDPEEIREDISQSREELGGTVAAVAEKADVKAQAQAKKEELKGQASAKAKELTDKAKEVAPDSAGEGVQQAQRFAKESPMAFAGVFLAGLLFGRLLSR
jgi:hypothetical protein